MPVVGIDELRQQGKAFRHPGGRQLEIAATPCDVGERRERVRSQADVAEPLRDRVQASRGRLVLPPERNCRERSGVGHRVLLGKLECTIDPFVDDLPIRWSLPHAGPACRLEREFRVEIRGGTGELDCLLDRGTERLAVESECVRPTDLQPELGLLASDRIRSATARCSSAIPSSIS